jgi:hypothetical protein
MVNKINGIPNYTYSIHFTLFNNENNSIGLELNTSFVLENTVLNKQLNGNSTIIKRNVPNLSTHKTPFILYITDLTNYVTGQPILELYLYTSVHPLKENRIPLSFKVKKSLVDKHRRIDMPLPPLTDIHLAFNLDKMVP